MVTVSDVVTQLGLNVVTAGVSLEGNVTGGYTSDLLSCVMAGAQTGNVWVTLQSHPNVVAVASLLGLSCVIVTEGSAVEARTIEKAEQEGIPMLTSATDSFAIVARLCELGIRGNDRSR
jgi:hypothetical protein